MTILIHERTAVCDLVSGDERKGAVVNVGLDASRNENRLRDLESFVLEYFWYTIRVITL